MGHDHGHDIARLIPEGPYDLAVELKRLREMRDSVIPGDITARMDHATRELAASKQAERAVAVGTRAPLFTLANAVGEQVALERLLSTGPVVLSFYRGAWCPFCNLEQRALQQYLPQFTEQGASMVAVSGQTPDHSLTMAEKLGLTYEVLSDVGLTVARSYGLVFELPEDLQQDYARMGHPLPRFNGTEDQTLPIPATFVIDRYGVVRFSFVNPDYMHRADPESVLDALRALA